MSNLTLAPARAVLVDSLGVRSFAANVTMVVAGAALTAGAAQLVIPMWPVPITGQTFAVLLVGTTLGALRGGLAMVLYIALGAIGLPIFSEGSAGWQVIAGPTGGYLVGFVLAAVLTGWLAQRSWDRKVVGAGIAFLAGTVVIYAVGLAWLSVALGQLGYPNDLGATLQAGLLPFVPGDILKAIAAGVFLPVTWRLVSRAKK